MVLVLDTVFAALLGLAFGSFLNVCLSRWPRGESIVTPPSHCMSCGRRLSWWENVPLVSWLALGGRCRTCKAWIGLRYFAVEAAIGGLWGFIGFRLFSKLLAESPANPPLGLINAFGLMIFCWLLVGLAVLDAEHLWLADAVTIPGIILGLVYFLFSAGLTGDVVRTSLWRFMGMRVLAAFAAAALILLIRWTYWLVRHREGIGLGDAKLMAMLAAWLGLSHALLSFFIGVVLGGVIAIALLATQHKSGNGWTLRKLPLGTFLCIGGIVSALWGNPLIAAYLRWCRF